MAFSNNPTVVNQAYNTWVIGKSRVTHCGTFQSDAAQSKGVIKGGVGVIWCDPVSNQINVDTVT